YVLERLDQPAGTNVIAEHIGIDECNALAAQRVLHSEQRRVEYQAALDVQGLQPRLTDELRPQVVARRIRQAYVDQFVRLDEFGQAQALATRRDIRVAQHAQ